MYPLLANYDSDVDEMRRFNRLNERFLSNRDLGIYPQEDTSMEVDHFPPSFTEDQRLKNKSVGFTEDNDVVEIDLDDMDIDVPHGSVDFKEGTFGELQDNKFNGFKDGELQNVDLGKTQNTNFSPANYGEYEVDDVIDGTINEEDFINSEVNVFTGNDNNNQMKTNTDKQVSKANDNSALVPPTVPDYFRETIPVTSDLLGEDEFFDFR